MYAWAYGREIYNEKAEGFRGFNGGSGGSSNDRVWFGFRKFGQFRFRDNGSSGIRSQRKRWFGE